MNFASDNTAPVAPNVMDAMVAANQGTCPSYGVDSESEQQALCCQKQNSFMTL
jgi:threonine aldolase